MKSQSEKQLYDDGRVAASASKPSRQQGDGFRSQPLLPHQMIHHIWRMRELVIQFTRRDIETRYRDSVMGILWTVANPLLMLAVYTFAFGLIFRSRWPQSRSQSLTEFALIIFCGITIFNLFSETVNRAPTLVINVPNFVKKVVFPLEILPISALLTALFNMSISLCIVVLGNLLFAGSIPWTTVFIPLIILPVSLLSLGSAWFLASLGVFFRDIGPIIAVAVQALFFLTPIFYTPAAIPEPFRSALVFNPIADAVEQGRNALLFGIAPDFARLGLWIVITSIVAILGYGWFMLTKKAFADVV